MRVFILSPYHSRLNRGIETFSHNLAEGLVKRGHRVGVLSWRKSRKMTQRYGNTDYKTSVVTFLRYFEAYQASVYYFFHSLIFRDSIYIINFLYHGESSLRSNSRILYVLNSPASQVPARYNHIKKSYPKFKDFKFIAVSNFVRKEAIDYLGEDIDITTIYNGVNSKLFKRTGLKGDIFDELKLVTFSAFEERKGIQNVIRLVKELKLRGVNVVYDVYGDGAFKQECVSLVNSLDLNNVIRIMPSISNVCEAIGNYHIFVLLSRGEAMPIAPLEALASGLPLLTSNHKPYDEIVKNGCGISVNPLDIEECVQATLSIMGDYAKFSEAAYLESKRFDWEEITKQYLDIIGGCSIGSRDVSGKK